MIRVAVVDDEPFARQRIVRLLEREEGVEIVAECGDGREAVEAIRALRPDLVFLDVQMPEMTGFDVVEAIGAAAMPAVVFVTAYDQYALRAFEISAVDYLLKPFEQPRLNESFRRARERILARQPAAADTARLSALLASVARPEPPPLMEWLLIGDRDRAVTVRVADIDWLQAEDNYVRVHAGGRQHVIRETLRALEQRLDPRSFARIHRSVIVNIHRVKEMRPWFAGVYLVVLQDGTELKMSRSYRRRLGGTVGSYL